jgi:hypothetical protein
MSDYPVEVYELLKWFLENPGGKWADVPEGLKEIGWDFIKRDNLHYDTGTHHTVPGLSGFGRVVLRDRGKTKPPDADESEKSKAKRKPRGSSNDKYSETLTIGALKTLLNKRGRDDPPTGKDVANESGVANVSRFIRKHFGSQKVFEAAWERDAVRLKLASLEYGDSAKRHPEYDETRPNTNGQRCGGREPGSGDDND